jgi:hypothetical protein
VNKPEDVPIGSYFVRYDPIRHERWAYALSDRPWRVALMGASGVLHYRFSFTSIDLAVRRAQRLQKRIAS